MTSEPVNLVGHFYGALRLLEAPLLLTKNARKLVLYEPFIYTFIGIPCPLGVSETFSIH